MWRLKIVSFLFFLLITTRNIRYFIIEILISIFHTVKIILSFLEFKFVLKSKFLLALRPYLKSSFLFSQLKMAAYTRQMQKLFTIHQILIDINSRNDTLYTNRFKK